MPQNVRSLILTMGILMVGSVVAGKRFESLFSWGTVKDDARARAYAEIGVTDVFARGPEGFAAAKKYGMRAYCSFFPCGRNQQVVTPKEQKYLDYINVVDLWKQNAPSDERSKARVRRLAESKCQFGGEPVTSLDTCPEPLPCFLSDTNGVKSVASLDKVLKDNPEADGVVFDYIGYTNLHSCECDGCKTRLKTWLEENGLEETETNRNRFFREGLVTYINALVDHVKRVRPEVKVSLHLYPAFLPDPLYGKDLKADFIQETVAWYFPWPETKIADYTRKILESRHLPGSVSMPFVGLEANPESVLPLKTPERLEAEMKLILANGGTSLAVCNGDDMLKPGYDELFRKYTKGK